ncbi:ETX/MTX2 family pore-forming toxin [Spiroplasma endosymbiont of Seladonia tumulorum]|uniref:ETX/MTX2 family pore-forming toxin n=1 Tax=Spiroplasma endosymbiont of Seladonia tumulorum TaxID=3066321 RepID=UPI0030D59693
MKKLLSLLSVLTISGTAVPTTVAASSYQQKENNLENLIIRNKRQNNKQNITEISQVVITTGGDIKDSGVVLNNKLYFGSDDNNVYEYDPLELIESEIINIQEQIKRGLYLYYKKQNPSYKIKKIYNINLKNLTLSDVTLKQTQKNKSSNLEQDINDFCKDSDSTFINNSSIEQTQNTVSCSKQLTETNTFQKMNGFSKSELTSNTENWNWNVNGKVTVKTSSNAGVPLVFGAKLEVSVEVVAGKTWGGSKNYTIGEVTNSSNTEIKTTTETMTINVPSQPVKIPPHSKISISVNAWKNNIVLILSYYQKVQGMVSADFLDKNNNRTTVSISIKDAMSSLLENNILPSKIIINNDNSIKFSYDIKSQKEIIMHQTEIGEAIPLNSYEQNETFKDNTMGVGL